ncbi:MAG: DUF1822 family protein [Symploca sp. SIO2E9]|nr:DUF1822 family protein [Symploca sp. SIO2E9]
MNSTSNFLIFTVPLTLCAHELAQQFYHLQSDSNKGKQIYFNTLAVYAVNFYLNCLGIETDLEASDSWNPCLQPLANNADLLVKNVGKLECRPVLPEEQLCKVPEEVMSDRIGYVAVKLDSALTEAQLLGFVPSVVESEIPIHNLQSLEELLEVISPLKSELTLNNVVLLRQWLDDIFDRGWEKVSELFDSTPAELGWSYRRLETGVKRGKLLHLGRQETVEEIALLVGLRPTQLPELNITVEVYPTGDATHLPRDLQLMVLDEDGETVMQAIAKSTKNIQLEFSGEEGESFSVKLSLNNCIITEDFII